MTDERALLMTAMAHDAARGQLRALIAVARAEYRATSAPYGDDDQGFWRWLFAHPRLTSAA